MDYNGYRFSFDPADPDIVSVSFGLGKPNLLTGLAPGKTVLTATLSNPWDDSAPVFTAQCEVIVAEE